MNRIPRTPSSDRRSSHRPSSDRRWALGMLLVLAMMIAQPRTLLGACTHEEGSVERGGYCCCRMQGCGEEHETASCCTPEHAPSERPPSGPQFDDEHRCTCPSPPPATSGEVWTTVTSSATDDATSLACLARGADLSGRTPASPPLATIGAARSGPWRLLVSRDTGDASTTSRIVARGVPALLAFFATARS